MKTFADLIFKRHPNALDGSAVFADAKQATLQFDNGYGVSVISGEAFYTRPGCPYEMAIRHGEELCYATPITDDVMGYLTEDDVTERMRQVQELPKNDSCTCDNKPEGD